MYQGVNVRLGASYLWLWKHWDRRHHPSLEPRCCTCTRMTRMYATYINTIFRRYVINHGAFKSICGHVFGASAKKYMHINTLFKSLYEQPKTKGWWLCEYEDSLLCDQSLEWWYLLDLHNPLTHVWFLLPICCIFNNRRSKLSLKFSSPTPVNRISRPTRGTRNPLDDATTLAYLFFLTL